MIRFTGPSTAPLRYFNVSYLLLSVALSAAIFKTQVYASPVISSSLSRRMNQAGAPTVGSADDENYLLGYVFVRREHEWEATEYNQAETLTAISTAMSTSLKSSLGDGAYLFPRTIMSQEERDDFWKCRVTGSRNKILAAPKLFIGDRSITTGSFASWLKRPYYVTMKQYEIDKNLKVGETILFSTQAAFPEKYQMLIPFHFLANSHSRPTTKAGGNRLGIKVKCVGPGYDLEDAGQSAKWEKWGINEWPPNVAVRGLWG